MGKVYGNLMVDLNATNEKLRDRSVRIVMRLTQLSRTRATRLLEQAKGTVKAAIVMHFRGVNLRQACAILEQCDQSLRKALRKS